jgi:16S rRNA (uracil1498-N3)-methyltransferase
VIRVFVEAAALSGDRLHLQGDAARHLGGALRIRPGERLIAVTEDAVEHTCEAISASAAEVVARVVGSAPSRTEPSREVRLCQALLKGDQFERILEYCSELGVTTFQPLLTERTIARPEPSRLERRAARWRQVCRQGAELGQRGRVPTVLAPAPLAAALAGAERDGLAAYLLYEGAGLPGLSAVVEPVGGICLLVGPEGGWSESEVMLARGTGARPVTLGPRIMRPLPAALAAVGIALDRSHDLELKEDR